MGSAVNQENSEKRTIRLKENNYSGEAVKHRLGRKMRLTEHE